MPRVTNAHSLVEYHGEFVSLLPDLADIEFFGGNGEFWTNITYSNTNVETGAESSSFYSTSGIDFVTTEGLVWGILMQLDLSDETGARQTPTMGDPYSSSLESFGWLTGPYVVYDSGGFLVNGSGRLIGASNSEISPYGAGQSLDEFDSAKIIIIGRYNE